jgi:Protein of unknown function (DUF2911)
MTRMRAWILASVVLIGVTVAAAIHAHGSTQRTRVSPHETVSGMVDGATITIVYGRPSMRGRTIFGSVVPFDRVWCPGADEATTIESSVPMQIGGVQVPTGPHTIWLLPTREAWTLIISKQRSGFHTYYPADQDLGRIMLRKRELDAPVEQLTFAVTSAAGGGELTMRWERTEVSAPFTVMK